MKKITLLDFEINRTKKTNRWLGLLSVCMMFLVGQLSFAQVQVGYDTTASYSVPFQNLWNFSYTQSIYTAGELSADAGNITAIQYYYAGTSDLTTMGNFTMYIGHTTKSSFAGTTIADWEPVSNLTEVFTGGVTALAGAGWVTITLDTPFAYDGVSNLIVAIDDNQTGYNSSAQHFRYSNTATNRTMQHRSDSVNFDPNAPVAASTRFGYVPNTVFVGLTSNLTAPTCLDAAPAFAETSAGCGNLGGTFSWTAPSTGFVSGYKVYIGTSAGNYDVVNGTVVTGLSYTMANSAINTTYYYSIVPTNPAGDAMACDEYSFTTASNICYCTPTTTGTYYFSSVSTTGGDSNISLTKTAKDTGGYGDYTSTQIVSGFEGQTIQFNMAMNTSTHYFYVWIDFNGNGLFTDAGENVVATTSYLGTYSGTLTIPTLPLGDYRIRIGSSWSGAITSCGSANGEYQDFTLTVVAPPPCMAPTALTATMLSMSSAEFSWTSTGSLFDLEWGVQGFTPGTGTMVTDITTTSHQVTGLTLGTTYEFYVLQDCGAVDGESIWSGPVSVYVGFCIPTYGSGCTSGDDIDDFTLTGSGISHIGTGCSTGSYADYSADPTLQGTVTQGETYSFSATHNFGSQYVKIWIDFNDNGTFEDTELLFTSTTGSAATSGTITIPIDAPLGVHRMRVQGKWNSVSTNACNPTGFGETHDYTVTVVLPPCDEPTGFAADDITTNSVELSWTGTADSFDIEYGVSGFTSGSGTMVTGVTSPYILSGLTYGTDYDVYVRGNCTVNESDWVGPVAFTTLPDYCTPVSTSTSDYISAFSTTGGTQNISYSVSSQPTGGYDDQTIQVIEQAQGLSVNFSSTFVGGGNGIKIWVDLNNDFIFDNTTEVVFYEVSSELTKTGTITIPVDLPVGDYRVRVRGQWGSAANPTPCGSISWGSAIDFTLSVTAAPSCLPPSGLAATMLSMSSAEFSWTSTGSLFDLEWGVQGFTPGTGTMVTDITTTSHQVTGLTLGTTYEFYVRQDCGAVDGESIWSGPVSVYVGYCIPTYGSGCTSGDDIDDFTLTGSGISHTGTGCSTGAYADYSADPTLQGTVTQGETYSFSATHNFGSQYVKIWIDFNDNGTFEDTELLFTSTTGSATTSGTITIPVDAPLGAHRMRVQGKWNSASTNACNPTGFGETHDYTVTVTDPCAGVLAPTGDATQEVASGSTLADLDVTAVGTLTWYSDVTLTTVLPDTTEVVDGITYWVTNTEGACESDALAITVTVTDPCAGVLAPTGDATQEVASGSTLADLDVNAVGTLTWYSDVTLTTVLPDTTEVVDGATYWVTNIEGACESDALEVTVTVTDPCAGVNPPTADSPQPMSAGQTVSEIVVTDVTGTLNWYSDEDLTSVVDESTELTEGTHTFWVTQTIDGCESDAIQVVVEVSLSTNVFDNASFRTYPNPVRDIFNISYSKDITNVTVLNMLGQTVITKTVNSTDTQIDMTGLPTGSYFVKVTADGAVKTVKVIKQ